MMECSCNQVQGRDKAIKLGIIFLLASILAMLGIAQVIYHDNNSSSLLDTVIMVLMVVLMCLVIEMCWRNNYTNSSDTSSNADAEDVADTSSSRTQAAETVPPPSYEEIMASGELSPSSNTAKLQTYDDPSLDSPADEASQYSEAVGAGNEVQLSVECLPTYEEAIMTMRLESATAVYIQNADTQDNQDLILFI